MHCRTRENAATYPPQRLQARPRSFCLTQNSVGLRRPRFPTTMLSLSWINLPNISISGLINPCSENIFQILVATFTLLDLLPRSFYFQYILCDRLNLRVLPTPKFMTSLLHSIYHSVAKLGVTCPCQITATTNVMNHFCTRCALFACSFKPIGVMYNVLPSIGHSFRSRSSGVTIQTTRSLVALAGWSLTRVDTQCVYHPLHEMWS